MSDNFLNRLQAEYDLDRAAMEFALERMAEDETVTEGQIGSWTPATLAPRYALLRQMLDYAHDREWNGGIGEELGKYMANWWPTHPAFDPAWKVTT